MIRFFFEYNNEIICLPVNPPGLMIQRTGNNTTVEIVNLGQINLLRDTKLKKFDIVSFFPKEVGAPYIVGVGAFKDPDFYVEFFNKIMSEKKPCRLVVVDTKINLLVSIEGFDYQHEALTDDITYKLSLQEYIPYASQVVQLVLSTPPAADIQTVVPTTNTVTAPAVVVATQTTPAPTRQPRGLAVGDRVGASGRYYSTSYGNGSSGVFPNGFVGSISLIVADTNRSHRFHVAGRGWVTGGQIWHA